MKSIVWLPGLMLAGGVFMAVERPDWATFVVSKAHAEGGLFGSATSGNRVVDEGIKEKHREADQLGKDYADWDHRRICWQDTSRARQFERDSGYSMPQAVVCEPMKKVAQVQRKLALPPAPAAPEGYDDGGYGCECRPPETPPARRSNYQRPRDEYGYDTYGSYQYYQ